MNRPKQVNNQSFRSRDWLSANQGPVFPDLVDSCSRYTGPYLIRSRDGEIPLIPLYLYPQHVGCGVTDNLPVLIRRGEGGTGQIRRGAVRGVVVVTYCTFLCG
eukprot:sb/3478288/